MDFDDSQLSLDVWGGSRNDDRPTGDDCKQDSGRSNSGTDRGDFGDRDVWITFSLDCWKYSNSRIIFPYACDEYKSGISAGRIRAL